MNDRSLFLAVMGWTLVLALVGYQIVDYLQFRYMGKRFTASDGQALCLRIQALEATAQPCEYK